MRNRIQVGPSRGQDMHYPVKNSSWLLDLVEGSYSRGDVSGGERGMSFGWILDTLLSRRRYLVIESESNSISG